MHNNFVERNWRKGQMMKLEGGVVGSGHHHDEGRRVVISGSRMNEW